MSQDRSPEVFSFRRRLIITLFFTAIAVILFVVGAVFESRREPTGGDAAPEGKIIRFCHNMHRLGVAFSAATTLLIYYFANASGWLNRVTWKWMKDVLYLPFMALTLVAGVICWFTVGNLLCHWAAVSAFFGVFVVWDILFLIVAKAPDDWVTQRCQQQIRRWLLHVDVFNPVLLWVAYCVVCYYIPASETMGVLPIRDVVLTGVLISILFAAAWDWLLDLLTWSK
jgi:hypothetical protein